MRPIEVVGSINVDLVTTTSRIPKGGETIKASSFSVGNGGKGANQAVACARLLDASPTSSAIVRMVGAVGGDQFGQDALNALRNEGINHDHVLTLKEEKTGTTVIIVEDSSGENRILFTPGANYLVTPERVSLDTSIKNNIVLFQLELPLETVRRGLHRAKSLDKVTMLNPAPASRLPDDCYSHLDHLIVNESEASVLSGVKEDQLAHSLDSVADFFIGKGVKYVIITLGAQGVFWKLRNGKESSGNFLAAHQVKAVDTTAAGDTFVGAYAAYLNEAEPIDADGHKIRSAITFANLAASMSVQRRGAQASIPLRREMPTG